MIRLLEVKIILYVAALGITVKWQNDFRLVDLKFVKAFNNYKLHYERIEILYPNFWCIWN